MDISSFSDALASGGGFELLIVFGFGFLTSLTPCVYPLIPVTLALFGASEGSVSRTRAFFLSLTYVLGIAVTYTALGLFTSLTGALFGSFLGSPVIVLFISLALFVLILFTLDVIDLKALSALPNRAGKVGGQGFGGAFLLGLASGIIAAPCTGPALAAILAVTAKRGDPLWGSVLLFTYSLGIGLIFIVLGTFSGLVKRIPKSGNWFNYVKFLIAVSLGLVIVFFIKSSPLAWNLNLPLPLLIGIFASGIFLAIASYHRKISFLKVCSVILVSFSAYELIFFHPQAPARTTHSLTPAPSPLLTWEHSLPEALSAAKARGTIVVADLYADWCASCIEYERITFIDPEVAALLAETVPARIDLTREGDLERKVIDTYSVIGLPTILFLTPDGSEIKNSRLTGFLAPKAFSKHLKHILKR